MMTVMILEMELLIILAVFSSERRQEQDRRITTV